MQIVAERMVRGEFTPRAAAAEIDRRADRLLEKRRWMIEQGRAVGLPSKPRSSQNRSARPARHAPASGRLGASWLPP